MYALQGTSAAVPQCQCAVLCGRGLKHRATLYLRSDHERSCVCMPFMGVYALRGVSAAVFHWVRAVLVGTRAEAPRYALLACRAFLPDIHIGHRDGAVRGGSSC